MLQQLPNVCKLLPKLTTPKRYGKSGWRAHCPAHNDTELSLRVRVRDDGSIRIACRAGCFQEDILRALGLTKSDLLPTEESDPPQTDPPEDHAWDLTNTQAQATPNQTTSAAPPQTGGNGHTTGVTVALPTAQKLDPTTILRSRGLTPEQAERHGIVS